MRNLSARSFKILHIRGREGQIMTGKKIGIPNSNLEVSIAPLHGY